jgi:hypothetical protein
MLAAAHERLVMGPIHLNPNGRPQPVAGDNELATIVWLYGEFAVPNRVTLPNVGMRKNTRLATAPKVVPLNPGGDGTITGEPNDVSLNPSAGNACSASPNAVPGASLEVTSGMLPIPKAIGLNPRGDGAICGAPNTVVVDPVLAIISSGVPNTVVGVVPSACIGGPGTPTIVPVKPYANLDRSSATPNWVSVNPLAIFARLTVVANSRRLPALHVDV